jgi:hypothetical protein
MENPQEYITEHKDHMEWRKDLEHCRREIDFYEKRLGVLLQEHRDFKMLPQAEQFQNQFIRQKEMIDMISHRINVHEFENAEMAKRNNGEIPDHCAIDHLHMREEINIFWKVYTELKTRFHKFNVECKQYGIDIAS